MKWIGISGSWRITNQQVEKDVRNNVKNIILKGDGIITGGALNVDSLALDEALKHDSKAKKIRVFLPVRLKVFSDHYRKRASEGVITSKQAENLICQLFGLKKVNSQALVENMKNTEINKKTYYQRNSEAVKIMDSLIAFQVNKSAGTQNTIDKAKEKGIPVKLYSYSI